MMPPEFTATAPASPHDAKPAKSKVITVTNQKGGVGKTTTAINLAAALALSGKPTLIVDVDPQGNATSGLGLKGQSARGGTIYQALTQTHADATGYILHTAIDGLDVIPATRDLAGAEIELISMDHRDRRLRDLLAPLRARYRFIVIDCPPSLGLLTLNALVAADTVLIPLHCEYFALEGLADLIATLRRVRAALNPTLDVEGVLLTMSDERTNLGQQVAKDVRAFFKEKVYRTVIPRNVRLAEAPSHGVPAVTYDAKSRGAEAYISLANELLERNHA
ncbi:MAG TPA: ParA family protein [Vicinamibacterales bacterium]|nr:ParA family protein [Vicinamibacterales bacterium]